MKKRKKLESSEHPYRIVASLIIQTVIEPLFRDKSIQNRISSHGLEGRLYFQIEDVLTDLINKNLKK